MGKTLTTYVNEAVKGSDIRLVDMEEIVYPDGKVIKIADVEEKFHTSCMYIFSAYAFFAPAVKALTPIITNEIDTMATDGIRIFMNPRFTAELTDTQCIFVILHECMHNILNHLTREKQNGFSDHQRANIAADYEVNGILENDDWIYYVSEGRIYKIKTNGTQKQLLIDVDEIGVPEIQLQGDWLYYEIDDKIYRLKTDGTEHQLFAKLGEVFIKK